jgi:hypothetical protein
MGEQYSGHQDHVNSAARPRPPHRARRHCIYAPWDMSYQSGLDHLLMREAGLRDPIRRRSPRE